MLVVPSVTYIQLYLITKLVCKPLKYGEQWYSEMYRT